MAYVPPTNSVVAFQGDPTKLVATVSVVSHSPQSVAVLQGTNPWQVNVPTPSYISYQAAGSVLAVSGSFSSGNTSVTVNNIVTGQSSVQVLNPVSLLAVNPNPASVYVVNTVSTLSVTQGTDPWKVNVPTPSYITYQAAGSVMAVSATVNTGNSSVQLLVGQAVIGSVAVLQGTDPWKINVPTPSYIAYQAAGSVMAISGSFSAGNTSVSAYIESTNTSIFTLVKNSSIAALQGTNPWLIGNSSVHVMETYLEKNAVTPSAMGIVPLFKIDETNSVLSAVSPQSPFPVRGSVAVLQGTNPWQINVPSPSTIAYQLAGSVLAVSGSFSGGNSSVNLLGGGTVYLEKNATTASALGIPILFKIDETNSVLSAVSPQSPLPVKGSVAVLQGTNPWAVTNTSVVVNNIVTGQSSVYLIPGVGVLGSVAVLQGTSPWLITGSVMATGNTSVTAFQGGAWSTSMVGGPILVSSIPGTYQEKAAAGNASALGLAILFKNNVTTSTMATVSTLDPLPVQGSVTNLQGTNPWVVNVPTPSYLSIQPGGSVLNANISGSVAAVVNNTSVWALQGTAPWVIQSIVGTYAEDSGHTTADKGIFTLGVRNDAVSSITSTERDYSPIAMDEVGRTLTKPFAGEQACIISYFGSVVSGSVTLVQASVTGSRSYITDFWLSNTGSTTTLVTFQGGDTSLLGQFVAPAGGGMSSPGIAIPLRTTLSQDLAFKVSPSQSILYVALKGYQAP